MIDPYRDVLSGFLARDPMGLRDAPATLMPVIRGLACRLAADLVSAGFCDEVVAETFTLLLSPTGRSFDPGRGTSRQYLFGAVLTAAAAVRVQYGAAGVAHNDRRLRLVRDRCLDRDQCDSGDQTAAASPAVDALIVQNRRNSRLHVDPAYAICLRVDVENALKSASAEVRRAAVLVGEGDVSMSQAAAAVRLDRNTLRRRLRGWAEAVGLSA